MSALSWATATTRGGFPRSASASRAAGSSHRRKSPSFRRQCSITACACLWPGISECIVGTRVGATVGRGGAGGGRVQHLGVLRFDLRGPAAAAASVPDACAGSVAAARGRERSDVQGCGELAGNGVQGREKLLGFPPWCGTAGSARRPGRGSRSRAPYARAERRTGRISISGSPD